MLHLFRKTGAGDGTPMDSMDGSVVVSHILVKFLKRLRHMERPHLLDLGRVSGSNIEFFVQAGCKVRVEDLLLALDSEPVQAPLRDGRTPEEASGPPSSQGRPLGSGIPLASDAAAPALAVPLPADVSASVAAPTAQPASILRPGARPSRRIVLPPRTFASARLQEKRPEQDVRPRPDRMASFPVANALLPTTFDYADESFDAIVAWDIFNYYAPGAMGLLAAESRRILKPGGLLLGFFHARSPQGPERPRRYRILDEGRLACAAQPGQTLQRHVYQNRDIEKMFVGMSIVELYFLKNATRELLMEKKTARPPAGRSVVRPATPKPRFTLE